MRDLPAKSGSVLPEQDFTMLWEQSAASRPRLRELAAAVKQSDVLVLATDPDREGEAISWHVQEELQVPAEPIFLHFSRQGPCQSSLLVISGKAPAIVMFRAVSIC